MHTEFLFEVMTKVWLAGEILIVVVTQTRHGQGRIQDRGTQVILWLAIVGSLWIDGLLHSRFPPDMPGSHTWLRPAALGILALGLAVRAIAVVTLGRAFSTNVATQPGQTLQRHGLYRLVRHPSYLGLELILLAFALHARTWVCFVVVLIPTTLALLYRIHVEESALRVAFGAEYESYCRTTKRLIPGIY
jgi:protein-S-isoprenylcysteine O-methyltransferase Ste14